MKIKSGDTSFKLDVEIGSFQGSSWRENGDSFCTVIIKEGDGSDWIKLSERFKNSEGRPCFLKYCSKTKLVYFLPKSDRDGEIIVRYWPPLAEV